MLAHNARAEYGNATQGRRRAVFLVLILLLFSFLLSVMPLSMKGTLQLLMLPCLLLVAYRVRIFEQCVPRTVVGVAALGAAIGAVFQFSHLTLASGAFVVSTVSDEDLRQQTKIYRDRLRRSLGDGGESLIGIEQGTIRDSSAARLALEKSSSLAGVIWGTPRWMSVELRQYNPLPLSSFPQQSVAQEALIVRGVPDLLLIRSVPSIGMSHGHERGTIHFLSEVIKAWRLVPTMTALGTNSGEFEGKLEAVARMQARWTSRAHIALPLWLAGTVHLIRATEGSSIQKGELTCAITQFREALAQFRTHDNPALEMSVRNNYAIALLVQSHYEQDPRKLRKKAFRQLVTAIKLRKNDPKAGAIVAINYLGLTHAQKGRAKNDHRR
jgi:hypothetical protein